MRSNSADSVGTIEFRGFPTAIQPRSGRKWGGSPGHPKRRCCGALQERRPDRKLRSRSLQTPDSLECFRRERGIQPIQTDLPGGRRLSVEEPEKLLGLFPLDGSRVSDRDGHVFKNAFAASWCSTTGDTALGNGASPPPFRANAESCVRTAYGRGRAACRASAFGRGPGQSRHPWRYF